MRIAGRSAVLVESAGVLFLAQLKYANGQWQLPFAEQETVMNEYWQYLTNITGDGSWDAIDEHHFVNSNGLDASFSVVDRTTSLIIDGRLVYQGPRIEDHPEFLQSPAR